MGKLLTVLAAAGLLSILIGSQPVGAQAPSQNGCPPPPAYQADKTVGAKIPSLFILPFSVALTALVAPFPGPRNDMMCYTAYTAAHAATSNDFGVRGN